ncbi:MAG: MMPL family transporter [Sphaerobacteraceae bacterium]|nr:MAG: MMPL family transporter [Sphaerobacteraceae bacterium]
MTRRQDEFSRKRGSAMIRRLSTGGISRLSAKRPWLIVVGWVLVLAIAIGATTQMKTTFDGEMTNGAESVVAANLIGERIGGDQAVTEIVIVRSETESVDSPAFQAHVEEVTSGLTSMDNLVTGVVGYYDLRDAGVPDASSMVAENGKALLLQVEMGTDFNAAGEQAASYLETISELNTSEFEVMTVGDVSGNEEILSVAAEDLGMAQTYGLPAALIVLVVVFGALIAAGIPIIVGLMAVAVAFGLAAGVSQFFELDFFITNMIAMIGLAVGIDYSLFIIERYREERASGNEKLDAITIAGSTASKAVVFSGLTTTLALVGMFLLPMTTFQSLAIGAMLAVAASVMAALTLIPAVLSLLGDRINWPRLGRGQPTVADTTSQATGMWARITRAVMRRPIVAMILSVGLLLAATAPVIDLNTGQTGYESMPESNIKTAYAALQEDFYAGALAPVQIVVDGDITDPEVMAGGQRLIQSLSSDPNFGAASFEIAPDNDLAVISVPLQTGVSSDESMATVEHLRSELIPDAFGDAPATVLLTGATVMIDDFNSMLGDYMPIVFAFVLGLSFIVLMVAFRSIVIPFMSIFMNLLSVGAAYGLLVLAFQHGYGEFLGLTHTPIIEAWIPVFLFCILFGLSMDYHFFLLSRIREHFDLTGDNDEAVAVGLQTTGKIITGAALIMVVVFGAFAAGRLVTFQQLGFGLAVSVLLDATIVRSILVPSMMKTLGAWNWYLPNWMSWIPRVSIEGKRPELGASPNTGSVAPAPGGDD